jgi:hypothetical protein
MSHVIDVGMEAKSEIEQYVLVKEGVETIFV